MRKKLFISVICVFPILIFVAAFFPNIKYVGQNEKSLQILDIQILDTYGNEIPDDGGWYILSAHFQIQTDFQGEAEAITVFFVPTGSSMLAYRQQVIVYPIYDEESQDIKIISVENSDEIMEAIFPVVLETGLSGQLYVMVENMEKAVFSEHINISVDEY